ncbi:MAG TPA: hypothetical protein DEQ38_04470 [Elusimicrobia bacterium]|nr:MAG: hypothetical protein A2089_10475 [Elusimicrobia bacterium GWD2_63_28]HCC47356.1 hypothetical protein [Elusimicrobiota bacterium]
MSKKIKIPEPPQEQLQAPVPPTPPAQAEESVSNAQIWTFWLGTAAALITARLLGFLLPGVSESLIERWVMAGFGVFLVLFLLKLK